MCTNYVEQLRLSFRGKYLSFYLQPHDNTDYEISLQDQSFGQINKERQVV